MAGGIAGRRRCRPVRKSLLYSKFRRATVAIGYFSGRDPPSGSGPALSRGCLWFLIFSDGAPANRCGRGVLRFIDGSGGGLSGAYAFGSGPTLWVWTRLWPWLPLLLGRDPPSGSGPAWSRGVSLVCSRIAGARPIVAAEGLRDPGPAAAMSEIETSMLGNGPELGTHLLGRDPLSGSGPTLSQGCPSACDFRRRRPGPSWRPGFSRSGNGGGDAFES